ncbi:avidin-like [Thamnophis elegans]|uniref:avidin-like n=1 Tax=Thamnophis elegans TaxID=35005 RepID=UPI0013766D2D|nr:avidin-like [Thamnophis elegans]
MAIGAAALGLLALLLGCSGHSAEAQNSGRVDMPKCILSGNWTNDLASTVLFGSVSNTGVFSGVYQTAVSSSGNPIPPSPLQGIQHQRDNATFGFTVYWNASKSVTVFAGQCFVVEGGKELLKTVWLLRAEAASREDDWGATKVGTNTFYRTK